MSPDQALYVEVTLLTVLPDQLNFLQQEMSLVLVHEVRILVNNFHNITRLDVMMSTQIFKQTHKVLNL